MQVTNKDLNEMNTLKNIVLQAILRKANFVHFDQAWLRSIHTLRDTTYSLPRFIGIFQEYYDYNGDNNVVFSTFGRRSYPSILK